MSSVTINVGGWDKLRSAMLELPDRAATNSLNSSVGAGAAVFRAEARNIAPEYHGDVSEGHPPPGTLKRAIVTKAIPEQSTYYRKTWFVTVRRGKKYQKQGKKGNKSQDAYYWWFVENGHYYVPHGQANANRHGSPAGSFIPGKRFMRDAFANKKDAAVDAVKIKLAENIEKHAAELKS